MPRQMTAVPESKARSVRAALIRREFIWYARSVMKALRVHAMSALMLPEADTSHFWMRMMSGFRRNLSRSLHSCSRRMRHLFLHPMNSETNRRSLQAESYMHRSSWISGMRCRARSYLLQRYFLIWRRSVKRRFICRMYRVKIRQPGGAF